MVAIKNESKHNVPILGPDGRVHHTLPGDVFPEWAGDLITNPKVLGDQLFDDESREARYQEELAALQSKYDKGEADSGGKPDDSGPTPPPRSGPGSGVEAWADYALDREVEVDEGWNRDKIIAELESRKIPT